MRRVGVPFMRCLPAASVGLLLLTAGCASPLPPDSTRLPTPVEAIAAADIPAPDIDRTLSAVPTASATAATTAAAPLSPALRAAPRRSPVAPPPPDTSEQAIEEVVVRPGTVTGFWRLTASRTIDVDMGLFSGIHIRYGNEMTDRNICWLQQTGRSLRAFCSAGAATRAAEGSVDDDSVTMRWWAGPANLIFSGKLTEARRVVGDFSGGVIGVSVTGGVPASLTKLDLPPPDLASPAADPERPTAPLLRAVWQDLLQGQLSEGRYEAAAVKRVAQGLTLEDARDSPQRLVFLGQILIRWRQEQRETMQDVYQVDTSGGRKMCRIAANPQGQVIDFNCIGLPS